jgi:hypothetical protein
MVSQGADSGQLSAFAEYGLLTAERAKWGRIASCAPIVSALFGPCAQLQQAD